MLIIYFDSYKFVRKLHTDIQLAHKIEENMHQKKHLLPQRKNWNEQSWWI